MSDSDLVKCAQSDHINYTSVYKYIYHLYKHVKKAMVPY